MSSPPVKASTNPEKKAHPWRRCPIGKHFVREYSVHIPPSKKNPNGCIIVRHAHCAANRSHKDELSYDEIQYITNTYFGSLLGPPTSKILLKEYPKLDNYDKEIRGWTKYWNEVFQLDDPLDPNLIKALILMNDLIKYYKVLQEDNNENKNPAPSLMLELPQLCYSCEFSS